MSYDTDNDLCPTCGGEICEHGVCRANWCGQDEHCSPCWRRAEAEREAEIEANWQRNVIGPMFGWSEDDKDGQ